MKHKYFNSFLAGVALIFSFTACTPEDEALAAPDLTAADLVEGKAYKVEVDQATNKVKMTSLLGDRYVTSWIHPQGIEKKASTEANIPFAGDYEIQFGVMTRGGMVYGEPYRFTLDTTNGDLLTDPLWTYLTGGADQSKTWVLDHNSLDLGSFTFMCHYMGWDKFTEGKAFTEADVPDYKDYGYDNVDWVWQAGEPDWMFTPDVFAAFNELTFDLINGANVTAGGQTKAFVMDPDRKTLTMPANFNWLNPLLADNYLVDMINLELVKLNEHVLGIKVIRNDGLGGNSDQRMVMCYVEKGWDGSWPVEGPSLTTAPVALPTYDDLLTDLFTVVGDDATYIASANTFLLDGDMPYGYMEWNGTTKNSEGKLVGSWEWLPLYGTAAVPAYGSADEFTLVLSKGKDDDGMPVYTASVESAEGTDKATFTVQENKIAFDEEFTLLTTGAGAVSASEFTVLACNPDNEQLVLGIPANRDENGTVNRYLCVNMTVKPISGGQTGPTVLAVDQQYLNCYIQDSHHYRLEIYNPYYDADGLYPVDLSKLKLKKGQSIKIGFKLPGATWVAGADPKVTFGHNFEDLASFTWDSNDNIFSNNPTVSLNKDGVTEISLTNTTGGTLKFEGSSCITICIQQKGLVTSPLNADGDLDADAVKAEVVSITIE